MNVSQAAAMQEDPCDDPQVPSGAESHSDPAIMRIVVVHQLHHPCLFSRRHRLVGAVGDLEELDRRVNHQTVDDSTRIPAC